MIDVVDVEGGVGIVQVSFFFGILALHFLVSGTETISFSHWSEDSTK